MNSPFSWLIFISGTVIELTVGGRSVLFHDRPNLLHVVITPQLHHIQSVTSASHRLRYTSRVAGPNIHPRLLNRDMNGVHQVQRHVDTWGKSMNLWESWARCHSVLFYVPLNKGLFSLLQESVSSAKKWNTLESLRMEWSILPDSAVLLPAFRVHRQICMYYSLTGYKVIGIFLLCL